MPFYSGQGGSVTVLVFDSDWEPLDLIELSVASWSINDQAVPADVTNCSAEGARSATMGYSVTWTISLPAELLNEPDLIGMNSGEPVKLWFKPGTRAAYHVLSNTVVTATAPVCNSAGDVVRYTVSGAGGKIVYYSAGSPTTDPDPPPEPDFGAPPAGVVSPGESSSLTFPPAP